MNRPIAAALTALMMLTPVPWIAAQQPAVGGVKRAMEERLRGDRDKPRPEKWTAKGKVHSISREAINMMTESGEPWRVMVGDRCRVNVKGEGGPELLRPKVVVRFYAVVGKRGNVVDPISKLTVMTPREGFRPMMEPAPEEEQAESDEKKDDTPKAEVAPTGKVSGPGFGISTGSGGSAGVDKKGKKQAGERMMVMGVLTGFKKGRLTVQVGKDRVRGKVAEDAKVMADFTTHAMAKPGDTIEVTGSALPKEEQRGKFGVANGQTVTITPAPPAPKKGKEGKKSRRSRRER